MFLKNELIFQKKSSNLDPKLFVTFLSVNNEQFILLTNNEYSRTNDKHSQGSGPWPTHMLRILNFKKYFPKTSLELAHPLTKCRRGPCIRFNQNEFQYHILTFVKEVMEFLPKYRTTILWSKNHAKIYTEHQTSIVKPERKCSSTFSRFCNL